MQQCTLCGIDCYEQPGEELYFIAQFDTVEEAVKFRSKRKAERTVIIPAKTGYRFFR